MNTRFEAPTNQERKRSIPSGIMTERELGKSGVAAAGAAGETTMTQRGTAQVIGLRHVGLSARDPAALAEFYRDVLFPSRGPDGHVRPRRERLPQQPPGRGVG